ncbi:MAG: hypothetical protein ACO23N_06850 [Opitutales bacterium]
MSEESRKKPPRGDDRNLVIVDEDFAHADSEDRLWLFWERNQERLVGGTIAIVVGLIGWFAFQSWSESRAEGLRAEYAAVSDDAGRLAFAAAHPGETLAAVALLEVADSLKSAGKPAVAAYDAAATAAAAAGDTPALRTIGFRAKLYAGLLTQDTGSADASGRLAAVAENAGAPDAIRGQAMLALARGAIAKADSTTARAWLDKMDRQLGPNHPWREEQRQLIASEPSLRPSAARAQ